MVTANPAHLVAIGGIVGAVLRHFVSQAADHEHFPLGTLTVNVVGSFVLGAITFFGANTDTLVLVGTGVCGSFTTFSSFSFNTVRQWEQGERRKSAGFALANIAGSLAAIGVAWVLAGSSVL